MTPLILHLVGDYLLQSDWMAQNKTKSTWAAVCHATTYALPFAFIASVNAWLVIWFTHLLIDRFRLSRYVVWLKNVLFQPGFIRAGSCHRSVPGHEVEQVNLIRRWNWSNCSATGYPSDTPPWMAVWLTIIADNTIHLAINQLSLNYL